MKILEKQGASEGGGGPAAWGWGRGGGDLGEFTFGKRWGSLRQQNHLPNSLRSTAKVEPERLVGRISSGASAPNTGQRASMFLWSRPSAVSKTFRPVIASSVFSVGALLARSWRLLDQSWPTLGASWGYLGAMWAALGASWTALGALLAPLGAVLARLEALLGASGALLDLPWGPLGAPGAAPGASWGHVEKS